MPAKKHIILEGIDRTGKDSLIAGLQDRLGYFLNIHYEKPKALRKYFDARSAQSHLSMGQIGALALRDYQEASFVNMLHLLSGNCRTILNRAHLGEYVYSPRYRGYDGSYVFELEQAFIESSSKFREKSLLVLLTTSDFSFIQDDGLSFDFTKKEEEQEDFIKAFNQSAFTNKLLIDVSNSKGGYRPYEEILEQVVEAFVSR
jgi:hypothetical protein